MADAPADPALFYEKHIFMCTNVRPEGHPRGCCMARSEEAGGVEKLRGYMREKARQLGIERLRFNAAGCLDRCEFGPNMVIYPEGVWYPTNPPRTSTKSWRRISKTAGASAG